MALINEDRIKETTTTTGTGNVTLAGAATGFRTFASVMANNDTCVYCIEGLGEWEIGIGTFVSATPALARTTILSSSNAGAAVTLSAGTHNVFITGSADRLIPPQLTADPAVPSSGNWLYTRSLAGRWVPRFIGPSGVDTAVQPSLWGNTVTMWLPGTSTTAAINFGVSWTVNTTQAHPTIASTSLMTAMRRATFTTTTTTSNVSGVRSSAPLVMRGDAAGKGGFFFAARFGITTYVSTMRIWVGLSALSTALTAATNPSAIANSVYMGKDTGETVWQVATVDSTPTASKTSTGRTTAAAGATDVFDFQAFCKPNDTQITVRVIDITTGTVLVDNVSKSSNLPTNTTPLYAHAECQTAAASACAIFLCKMYIESDD
jgi:hypothetical protein